MKHVYVISMTPKQLEPGQQPPLSFGVWYTTHQKAVDAIKEYVFSIDSEATLEQVSAPSDGARAEFYGEVKSFVNRLPCWFYIIRLEAG